MRVLIDTQVLLWWFREDPALSAKARRTIATAGNEVLVSAASGWEMAIKNKSGKLDAQELLDRLEIELTEGGFLVLPISLDHALRAGSLTLLTRTPLTAC